MAPARIRVSPSSFPSLGPWFGGRFPGAWPPWLVFSVGSAREEQGGLPRSWLGIALLEFFSFSPGKPGDVLGLGVLAVTGSPWLSLAVSPGLVCLSHRPAWKLGFFSPSLSCLAAETRGAVLRESRNAPGDPQLGEVVFPAPRGAVQGQLGCRSAFCHGNPCSLLPETASCDAGKLPALAVLLEHKESPARSHARQADRALRHRRDLLHPNRLPRDVSPRLKACSSLSLPPPSGNGPSG